jgi:DNA-binding IclR family transcriptional regulator
VVKVIARSFAILRAVARSGDGMRLGDLAREVDLPRSTANRIVRSLQAEGVVIFTTDGRVRIGPDLVELAATPLESLTQLALPLMRRLALEVGETVDLATLEGDSVRFIGQASTSQRLRAGSVIGEVFPAYCTANGKALLAELAPRALELALPKRLEQLTPQTITSRQQLAAELDRVRESGVAYDREEHTERICAVGAVAHDALGGVAALTVAAPSERFYGREEELAAALLRTTGELDAALGG